MSRLQLFVVSAAVEVSESSSPHGRVTLELPDGSRIDAIITAADGLTVLQHLSGAVPAAAEVPEREPEPDLPEVKISYVIPDVPRQPVIAADLSEPDLSLGVHSEYSPAPSQNDDPPGSIAEQL